MRCSECKHWDSSRKDIRDDEIVAFCRVLSPQVFMVEERFRTTWPITRPEEWCGCFEKVETCEYI